MKWLKDILIVLVEKVPARTAGILLGMIITCTTIVYIVDRFFDYKEVELAADPTRRRIIEKTNDIPEGMTYMEYAETLEKTRARGGNE